LKNFYFTFGTAHVTLDGVPMCQYYVRVESCEYWRAREVFNKVFAVPYMGRAGAWSFQYEEDKFKEDVEPWCIRGEYLFIKDEEPLDNLEVGMTDIETGIL
jgi:hypothetical protein